jgi:sugar lactone lactonase YvrE
MTIKKQGLVMAAATTRRQFTGLLCGGGLLTLGGCGGGSGGNAPPVVAAKITLAPQSASGTLEQSITLRVEASGSDLTYQWRRNGVTLTGATGSSLQVVVTPADDGAQYTVVVSNSAGQVESTAAILTVKSSGVISFLAGGLGGSGMLEGRGTQARLPSLNQVVASKDGSVYFGGNRTGKVTVQGDVTFLQDFSSNAFFLGMATDSKGDLYTIERGTNVINKLMNGAYVPYAGASVGGFLDGVGTAARLRLPQSPAFDSQDNLYFIDSDNHAVRKVAPGGVVTTVAGMPSNVTLVDGKGSAVGLASPRVLLVLADDTLLVIDGNSWRKVLPDGTVSTLAGAVPSDVSPWTMQGLATDALYAVRGQSVVKLALDGSTTLVAGNNTDAGYVDGVGSTARFHGLLSLSLSATGQLFVADQNAMIRRINLATGEVSAWAGLAPQPGRVDGEGAQARFADMGPSCVDTNGNVYVVDTQAKTLRKIAVAGASSVTGVVSTLFSNFPSDGDVAVDASGNFYGVRDRVIIKVLPSGAQQVFAGQPGVLGFADGLGNAASFARPRGLTLDSAGNLYVGDEPDRVSGSFSGYSDTYGGTLRRITPGGLVSTLAGTPGRVTSGSFYAPNLSITDDANYFVGQAHLANDADGTIWVSSAYGIRRVGGAVGAPAWILRSDPGTDRPCASDGAGGLWVADGKVIRKVLPNGTSTVAAGVEDARIVGVKLDALPGSLGTITSLVAASPNVLYCGSENAVVRIQLS